MSFSHHESEEQKRLLEAFREQQEGIKQRVWPQGRISADDEGELAFKIGSDPDRQLVMLDFGKPVTSVACSPKEAIQFAQILIKHARAISREPLLVTLH